MSRRGNNVRGPTSALTEFLKVRGQRSAFLMRSKTSHRNRASLLNPSLAERRYARSLKSSPLQDPATDPGRLQRRMQSMMKRCACRTCSPRRPLTLRSPTRVLILSTSMRKRRNNPQRRSANSQRRRRRN
ncbi:hypothetical protein FA95DRAFT_628682 [Auriscalpium vulgare]|uniref:Uncharacterized protein n=1 Tax=Auriscalpium vulgare TaxID=40419 RepID=A0ACB8RD32_9AGAM|nr:hypothetical protein FA95DRAFT_628682 [Auriscalpium vulgare]